MSPTSCQTAPPRNRGANYRRRQSGLQTGCPGACARSLPPAVLPGACRAGIADPLDVPLVFLLRGQVVAHLCLVTALLGLGARADGGVPDAVEDQLAALPGRETGGGLNSSTPSVISAAPPPPAFSTRRRTPRWRKPCGSGQSLPVPARAWHPGRGAAPRRSIFLREAGTALHGLLAADRTVAVRRWLTAA